MIYDLYLNKAVKNELKAKQNNTEHPIISQLPYLT